MSKLTSKVTIAADLAKDVFEIAVANRSWKVIERRRMTHPQFFGLRPQSSILALLAEPRAP